MYL
ncbi:unnamed protein product [Acanthoscelides obtectus]|jgi:hypothetical protein